MPKVRTATMATRSVRIGGSYDARTISHPAVAVSATPAADARPPSTVGTTSPGRRSGAGSAGGAGRAETDTGRTGSTGAGAGSATTRSASATSAGRWATTTTAL